MPFDFLIPEADKLSVETSLPESQGDKNSESVGLEEPDEVGRVYEELDRLRETVAELCEEIIRKEAVARLAIPEAASVLAIGANLEYSLVDLARAVGAHGRVYAIDIHPEAVAFTSRLLEYWRVADRVEFCSERNTRFHLGSETIDVLFFSVPPGQSDGDNNRILAESFRVLRPSSRIALVRMHHSGLIRSNWESRGRGDSLEQFTCRPDLNADCESVGFKIIHTSLTGVMNPVELVVGEKP